MKETGGGAWSDAERLQLVERQHVYFVARDLGNGWLHHTEALGHLRLGQPLTVYPLS